MNHQRFFRRRRRGPISLALAVVALAGWMASQIPGIAPSYASAQSKAVGPLQSKEEIWNRMVEVDSSITNLRNRLASNPKDKELRAQIEAYQYEYDQLSASLGGDRVSQSFPDIGQPTRPSGLPGGVIPPVPAGCTPATVTFSNVTPVPIPDNDPTGATSTINVAGVGTSLWDVNVTVNIPHTFAGDLDFTLTSPSGTVVTLSTDNGGSNDNVFDGTTFDDQADPNSQIPYAVAPNQVVDHTYANLVVATSLTPEEPLAAFNGLNPNGIWTLMVVDDAGGDTGTITSWSLEITTFAAPPVNAPPVIVANITPAPIPDNNPTGVTSTINIAGAGTTVCDVNVTLNITHTFPADLDVTLTSPLGTVVTLSTDNAGTNDNVFAGTAFDDQADPNSNVPYAVNPNITTDHTYANLVVATPLTPEEPLAAFNGEDPNGTWTLKVIDDLGADTGTLNSWSLNIVTCACGASCTLTCPANLTVSNDPDQCGALVNYPAPTSSGSCGTVTCSPASGSFFPQGTTTVTCSDSTASTCMFTVTVNDTQPPVITCPANISAVTDQNACPAPASQVVSFPPPTATDNCPGVTVVCDPPSGVPLPTGTTTVTCTATDGSGNTASCSFTVTTFDTELVDDANPANTLLWNSITGEYRFCCNGITFTGVGKAVRQGCVYTLDHTNASDRRVLGRVDKSVHAGTASLQAPIGKIRCTITDRNTLNDPLTPACQ